MKTLRLALVVVSFLFLNDYVIKGQTQSDTIYAYITDVAVDINGSADEDCWTNADWNPIENVWIPWGENMAEGDFEGKFKVSWDESYLYLLVEVIDDSLSDDYVDPFEHWWDDDCVEVFIDEDRSKGNHERNNNAFAYHINLAFDAIDMNSSGSPVNYKDHMIVAMDTIAEDTYLWEIAFRLYDETYSISDPSASRVTPEPNKIIGFTVAYCDNDETTGRENFIGSMDMTSSTANDNYITADYFGTLQLIDPNYIPPSALIVSEISNNTSEAGTIASFSIALNNPIDSNVVINISSSNTLEGTVIPEEITFTSENYNSAQIVTVNGVDDDVVDGDVSYIITVSVNLESDSEYRNLSETQVTVVNEDNDVDDVSSLDDLKNANRLIITPNPARDYIYVKRNSTDLSKYTIYNVAGAIQSNGYIDGEQNRLNINQLDQGSYLFVLYEQESIEIQRFIKL